MTDPYQPPQSDPSQACRNAPLYTLHGVVVATVLGSLAAAVVLVCLNYLSLGSRDLAKKTAIAGGSVYLLIIAFTALLPESIVVGLVMVVVQAGLGYLVAKQLQGSAIRYHVANGGRVHSNFRAAGIGLVTGFAIMFAVVFVLSLLQLGVSTPA